MITFYFDENLRTLIQSPGNQSPASAQTWVYGDNYNLAVYIVANGQFLPISPSDTLTAILYQPQPNLPEQQLAIIGTPSRVTDVSGNQYFSININLATTQLAALVQATNHPALCQFHFAFNPADLERFSESADVQTTVNPDPLQGATGGTPAPPGYPSNPNVFERIANKGTPSGYAALDATGKVPTAQLPTATAGGDMLKSVYDKDNNGIPDTCDTLVSSRVTGLGTAAVVNVPATGNATATQAVLGSDTRLADTRTPIPHQATHNGGSDPIPLASSTAQGLCPPVDGTTVQVVSGKLTATTTGTGDMLKSVFVTGSPTNTNTIDNALAVQTHQVPATGNATGGQLVLATDTRLADQRTPLQHESTHLVGGTDPIPIVTPSIAGLCPPVDNTSIQVISNKLSAVVATSAAPGIVKPDGSTITIAGNVISAVSAGLNVYAKVHATAAQALSATAGTMTQITWAVADYQSGGTWWTSGGLLTVPAGQGGFYLVGATLVFAVSATGSQRQIKIQTNGTAGLIAIGNTVTGGSAGSWAPSISLSGFAQLAVGNTVELDAAADVASLNTAPGSGPINLWLVRIS